MKPLIVSVCMALAISLGGSAYAEKTIVINTGEYVPFLGSELPEYGMVNHLTRLIFEDAGYEVEINFRPWARMRRELLEGHVDASVYWYYREDRTEHSYLSDPVMEERIVFFYRKDNPLEHWERLEDLEGFSIGAVREYTYTTEFWELGERGTLTLELATSDEINFRKLLQERIDLVPITDITGLELLRTEFSAEEAEKLDFHKKPMMVNTGHVLFPKENEDSERHLRDFNEGLARMKEDGTYDRLLEDLLDGEYSQQR